MNRKKETITLSIAPGTREKLEEIARRFEIYWGKSPSPSGLISAIATGELDVGPPFFLTDTQVMALQQAIRVLIDSGYVGGPQTLLALLLEKGDLEQPLRQDLLHKVSHPSQGWRIQVDEHIRRKQPFRLLYENAQGKEREYTVRFARVNFYEKRFYLDIWCDEVYNSSSELQVKFPELVHNRCLRLDRIKALIPLEGTWRDRLDTIEVQLQFQGAMVEAYEAKEEDIYYEIVDDKKIVTRKISNPHWLVRDVLRYTGECTVLAPEAMRQHIQDILRTLYQQHTLDEDIS